MDNKTLEALKGSIKKWEGIVAGTVDNKGAANCPLCQLFNTPNKWGQADQCVGCPIMAETGLMGCQDTPYSDYENAEDEDPEDEDLQGIAEEELAFLKSLLPQDQTGT